MVGTYHCTQTEILSRFEGVKFVGHQYMARCPAHEDRSPSLSIKFTPDGRTLFHCHAGCPVSSVLDALGLGWGDICSPEHLDPWSGNSTPTHKPRVEGKASQGVTPRLYQTAKLAVQSYERKLGPRSKHWVYVDHDGCPVGLVLRWDRPDGKKCIRPVSRVEGGWIQGAMPVARPLYALPSLRAALRVYVTEGEKDADAGRKLGLVTTTSAHGSKSPQQSDWSVLAGKEVVIVPDADDAGEAYADAVAAILANTIPQPTVRILRIPGLPPGGGFADLEGVNP